MLAHGRLALALVTVAAASTTSLADVAAAPPPIRTTAPCLVRGERVNLEGASVTPAAGAPFAISLADAQLTARLPTLAGEPAALEVHGPLRFQAERRGLWATLRHQTTLFGGRLVLRPGARLILDHAEGDAVVAFVPVDDEWISTETGHGRRVVDYGQSRSGQGVSPDDLGPATRSSGAYRGGTYTRWRSAARDERAGRSAADSSRLVTAHHRASLPARSRGRGKLRNALRAGGEPTETTAGSTVARVVRELLRERGWPPRPTPR